ncbi:MAG: protein phosphatase 2C domain-containing protein [Desulfoprunum sp.]|nr:protein phosphatase 2C domain-containing protein [Desulfoprunum sp.]
METEHILVQGSSEINEDTLLLGKDIFGVFDGATSLNGTRYSQSRTGGMIASSIACSVFSKNCFPLVELAKGANSAIFEEMLAHGVDLSARESYWSTSAAVVRIHEAGIEWIQTGDSFIILIYNDNSYKVLGELADQDYETLSIWKQEAEQSSFLIHQALKEQIKKTRDGMNRSYGVFNGEKEAEHFLRSGLEYLEDVQEILIFTDGLNIPAEIPERVKNFDTLVELYLSLGLQGLKKHIREIEKEDPACRKYPRFKCHDDIAAISIRPGL